MSRGAQLHQHWLGYAAYTPGDHLFDANAETSRCGRLSRKHLGLQPNGNKLTPISGAAFLRLPDACEGCGKGLHEEAR